MLKIKKNILFNSNISEPNLKINLHSVDGLFNTEMENEIDFNSIINSNINEPIDNEVLQFKYLDENHSIYFIFKLNNTQDGYTNAGFTEEEINNYMFDKKMLNSFFISEIYDGYSNNKTLVARQYYRISEKKPSFTFNNKNQISKIIIPKTYLNNNVYIDFYLWLSFYNAKSGKLTIFRNNKENKEYFTIRLYLSGDNRNQWKFIYPLPIIQATEDNFNQNYLNKINDTINNLEIKKPNYQKNKFFNPEIIKFEDLL